MVELTSFFIAATMPNWLKWAFWVSPLSYGEIGLTLNEFLSPRWKKVTIHVNVLRTLVLHRVS